MFKAGTRLQSRVCATQVMIIKPGNAAVVTCGGVPMSDDLNVAREGEPDPALAGGTVIGKRYGDVAETIEILCIKPGKGTLAADGRPLIVKAPKALPSSD